MSKHGIKIVLCLGLAGMALFAGNAQAMSARECSALPGNQFLAAVERGSCRVDIETAAGPDTTFADNSDDGHNRRGGGDQGGGGNRDGGGNDGGDGGNGGNPNGGKPGAKP